MAEIINMPDSLAQELDRKYAESHPDLPRAPIPAWRRTEPIPESLVRYLKDDPDHLTSELSCQEDDPHPWKAIVAGLTIEIVITALVVGLWALWHYVIQPALSGGGL